MNVSLPRTAAAYRCVSSLTTFQACQRTPFEVVLHFVDKQKRLSRSKLSKAKGLQGDYQAKILQ